jgi:hypothetical protein
VPSEKGRRRRRRRTTTTTTTTRTSRRILKGEKFFVCYLNA